MKKIFTRLAGGSFGKSVAQLTGGTALAQLLLLLITPILTRLYSPEQFGQYALFTAVVAVLVEIVTLRYHFALPLAKNENSARALTFLSLIVGAFMLALFALIFVIFGESIGNLLGVERPDIFFALVLYMLFIQSSNLTLSYWATRQKQFALISRSRIIQGVGIAGGQVGLGWAGILGTGLIGGQLIGQTAGNFGLLKNAIPVLGSWKKIGGWKRVRSEALRYKHFPMYSTWSGVANTLSGQLPFLMLTAVAGPVFVGLYSLGYRVFRAPLAIVGSAIGQVFYSRAGASTHDELQSMTLRLFRMLSSIGIVAALLVGMIAQPVFEFAFGEAWRDAGLILQILLPWLCLTFISAPLSTLPMVLGRQRKEMAFQFSILVARVAALLIGAHFGGALMAVALFSAVGFVWFSWFIFWNLSLTGMPLIRITLGLTKSILFALWVLSPLWASLLPAFIWGEIWLIGGAICSIPLIVIGFVRQSGQDTEAGSK